MGANAQTSVPTFTAGEILTATNMNISARTGIPVFADSTARDAAFGGTGEKTLAEGQFAYLESTNATQYYDGSAWQSVAGSSGLTLISTTTIGSAVNSVTVTGAFRSTYDNYKIVLSGGVGSTVENIGLQLGSTTTGYYWGGSGFAYGGTASAAGGSNAASFQRFGAMTTSLLDGVADLFNPNLAKNTTIHNQYVVADTANNAAVYGGFLNNTTQYTAFTLIGASAATMTGGTIKVYGYQNS